MYIGQFDPAEQAENEPFEFDYRRDLVSGETIVSVVFTISVIEGSDSVPGSRMVGVPVISGAKVRQRISGLLPSVTYRIEAAATTSQGNIKRLWGRVTCKD